MYEIYETFDSDRKYLSYYTVQSLYDGSSNKRKSLEFRIFDDLRKNNFEKIVNANKSIIYDHVHIVLEEFQLKDLSDEQLERIIEITSDVLKKKYHNLTYIVFNETFREIQKYLQSEGIEYRRLGRYGGPNKSMAENTESYLNRNFKGRREII